MYVFSEEIYKKERGTPRGKGVWFFGDRNKQMLFSVGSETEPITYVAAKKIATKILEEKRYPMYKTIYLHV